jgi:hypothetical protein
MPIRKGKRTWLNRISCGARCDALRRNALQTLRVACDHMRSERAENFGPHVVVYSSIGQPLLLLRQCQAQWRAL